MNRRRIREFGQALVAWLYNHRGALGLINDPDAEEDYGDWTSGVCFPLARALEGWIGPTAELVFAVLRDGNPEHALVRIGDMYIDGDGAHTKDELLSRPPWGTHYLVGAQELSDDDWEDITGYFFCPGEFTDKVEEAIAREFGDPSGWGLR